MSHAIKLLLPLLLISGLVVLFHGCADPRSAPSEAPPPAHTKTIVLWTNQESSGQNIDAQFTVAGAIAPGYGQDAPARLFVWAYIVPDSDVVWRDHLIADSLPPLNDHVVTLLAELDGYDKMQDSLKVIDSTCTAHRNDSDSCRTSFVDSLHADISAIRAQMDADTLGIAADSEVIVAMNSRRDSLGYIEDDRYRLSVWLDGDTSVAYPEAVFDTTELASHQTMLAGQNIYESETDSNGVKAKKFSLNLAQFDGADPNNIGYPLQFSWMCFPGSARCLSPGEHTISAKLTTTNTPGGVPYVTKITATLVLVYEEVQP